MLSKLCVRATLKNQNEDAVWVRENDSHIVGVVSDGCSTGVNSAWASQLLCYIFQSHCNFGISDNIMKYVISDLREFAQILGLKEENFLATFLPFIYNKQDKTLRIRTFGDGVYFVNGIEYSIDQQNTPDYIGYQVFQNYASNQIYLDKYPEIVYNNVDSFIVCSDGIDSFQVNQFSEEDPKESYRLLEAPKSENYLQRTYNILKGKKFTNSDDVSIVSYINT